MMLSTSRSALMADAFCDIYQLISGKNMLSLVLTADTVLAERHG